MARFTLAAGLAALLAVLVTARPGVGAAAIDCSFDNVPRIVAVGDVHGAFDQYLEILKTAGVIDRRQKWAGGKGHFVQLGDVVDRGADSRKAIDFLQRLERDASSAGGRVHFLIGNHEAMRMLGDMRYVAPGEYAAFATPDSDALRQQVVETYPADQRAGLLRDTPLGMIEMIRAFGPAGPYGSYLRKLNAVVKLNGIVFLHGGISPTVAAMSCTDINDTLRRELTQDLAKTRATPLESLTTREDGPLWYRGLARETESFAPQLEEILKAQQARAIVVGHTVTSNGRVDARFDGRVFAIDTGMNPDYVKNGRASALEFLNGVVTAIYGDKREILAGAR
jgi:hypothetical protein